MALLETRGLTAFYGDFQALYGIDTALEAGETVDIIGANGAGKSSYLKSIAGLLRGRPPDPEGPPLELYPSVGQVRRALARYRP